MPPPPRRHVALAFALGVGFVLISPWPFRTPPAVRGSVWMAPLSCHPNEVELPLYRVPEPLPVRGEVQWSVAGRASAAWSPTGKRPLTLRGLPVTGTLRFDERDVSVLRGELRVGGLQRVAAKRPGWVEGEAPADLVAEVLGSDLGTAPRYDDATAQGELSVVASAAGARGEHRWPVRLVRRGAGYRLETRGDAAVVLEPPGQPQRAVHVLQLRFEVELTAGQ